MFRSFHCTRLAAHGNRTAARIELLASAPAAGSGPERARFRRRGSARAARARPGWASLTSWFRLAPTLDSRVIAAWASGQRDRRRLPLHQPAQVGADRHAGALGARLEVEIDRIRDLRGHHVGERLDERRRAGEPLEHQAAAPDEGRSLPASAAAVRRKCPSEASRKGDDPGAAGWRLSSRRRDSRDVNKVDIPLSCSEP